MQLLRNVNAFIASKRYARRIATISTVTVGTLVGATGGAFATSSSTDVTGGAGDTFFTKITAYFTGHVLVAVLALLAVTVGTSMLISWGKRAAKSR
jgi:hypothetical protein